MFVGIGKWFVRQAESLVRRYDAEIANVCITNTGILLQGHGHSDGGTVLRMRKSKAFKKLKQVALYFPIINRYTLTGIRWGVRRGTHSLSSDYQSRKYSEIIFI